MSRGHSHGGGVCNCQEIWESAYIPGHPINDVARRNGIPQHAIGEWLEQLYQEMRYGSSSPYAHIVEEYWDAIEASGLGQGGYGGHGRRGTQGGTRHGTQGGPSHGRHGGHGGHGGYSSRLPTGGRPNGTHGRRDGRTAPTETSQSTLDPREAAQRERRQRRARAERRDAAEMDDMQKQMAGMRMGMGGGRPW